LWAVWKTNKIFVIVMLFSLSIIIAENMPEALASLNANQLDSDGDGLGDVSDSKSDTEILQDFRQSINSGDINQISLNFQEDAIVVSPDGEFYGKEEIRSYFEFILSDNIQVISLSGPFFDEEGGQIWDFVYTSDSIKELGKTTNKGSLAVKTENNKIKILAFTYDEVEESAPSDEEIILMEFTTDQGIIEVLSFDPYINSLDNPSILPEYVLSAFVASLVGSLIIVGVKTREINVGTSISKSTKIIVLVVIAIAIVSLINNLSDLEIHTYLQNSIMFPFMISIIKSGFLPSVLTAIIFGFAIAILTQKTFSWLKENHRSDNIEEIVTIKIVIPIFLISLSTAIFTYAIIALALPLSFISGYFQWENNPVELLLSLHAQIMKMSVLSLVTIGEVLWIVIGFVLLFFVLIELRKTKFSKLKRIVVVAATSIFFILITIIPIVDSFETISIATKFSLQAAPLVGLVIFSFLTADGYLASIKENIAKIKLGPESHHINIKVKITNSIMLVINSLGLSRGLLLILIPIISLSLPIVSSPVTYGMGTVISPIADYITPSVFGDAEPKLVFMIFFNIVFAGYLLFDISRFFKSFLSELLIDNRLHKLVRKGIGPLTATAFIGILILSLMSTTFSDQEQIKSETQSVLVWTNYVEESPVEPDQETIITQFLIGLVTLISIISFLKLNLRKKI